MDTVLGGGERATYRCSAPVLKTSILNPILPGVVIANRRASVSLSAAKNFDSCFSRGGMHAAGCKAASCVLGRGETCDSDAEQEAFEDLMENHSYKGCCTCIIKGEEDTYRIQIRT